MRKQLFTSIAILLVCLISSCGIDSSSSKTHKNRLLRLNLFSEPPTLDPRLANEDTSYTVLRMLYDGLTRIGPNDEPQASVAEHIEVSPDGLSYRIRLRKSLWSDGKPVTAHDFLRAWTSQLDPQFPGSKGYLLYGIAQAQAVKQGKVPMEQLGVQALGDYELLIDLAYPAPDFLERLAHPVFYPMHPDGSQASIGNGPFKLVQWRPHNVMTVERNALYWDARRVKIPAIQMVMVPDQNTELSMFENAELDWAGSPMSYISLDAFPSLDAKGLIHSKAIFGSYWYLLRCDKAPLDRPGLRRALAYSIDRRKLVEHSLGNGMLGVPTLLPGPLHDAHKSRFPSGDTQAARSQLQEGEEIGPLKVRYNRGDDHHRVVQAIQEMWREQLDIEVLIEISDWAAHVARLSSGDFMIGRLNLSADSSDPLSVLEMLAYEVPSGWKDPLFVELVEQIRRTPAGRERELLIDVAIERFHAEMPAIPLYHLVYNWVQDPKLSGVVVSQLGQVDFKWARFKQR